VLALSLSLSLSPLTHTHAHPLHTAAALSVFPPCDTAKGLGYADWTSTHQNCKLENLFAL
jgi:hypothetical protein